jgi:uncharacterized protein DUF5677
MSSDRSVTQATDKHRLPEMPAVMRARHPAAFAILDSAWELDYAFIRATDRVPLPNRASTAVAMTLFARMHRALGASICLVEDGYGDEAGAQARIALECLFDLAHLLHPDPTERERRAKQFIDYQWVAGYQKAKKAHEFGLIDDAELATSERNRQEHWDRHHGKADPHRGWTGVTIAKKADDAGLKDSYERAYRPLCDVTHNNSEAWRTLVEEDPAGVTAFLAGPQDRIDDTAVVALAEAIIQAADLLASLFGLAALRPAIATALTTLNRHVPALESEQ